MAASKTTKKGNTRVKEHKKQQASGGFRQRSFFLWFWPPRSFCWSALLVWAALWETRSVFFCLEPWGFLLTYFLFCFLLAQHFVIQQKQSSGLQKILAGLVFFLFLCGLMQLLTEGYIEKHNAFGLLCPLFCLQDRRRHYRRSDLYFHHLRLWNDRRICDHHHGSVGMSDPDHPAFVFRLYGKNLEWHLRACKGNA